VLVEVSERFLVRTSESRREGARASREHRLAAEIQLSLRSRPPTLRLCFCGLVQLLGLLGTLHQAASPCRQVASRCVHLALVLIAIPRSPPLLIPQLTLAPSCSSTRTSRSPFAPLSMVRRRKTAASRRRLPPQLVKRVLLHLLAEHIEHDDQPDADAALYNCCLASRAMRSVAQPLLWSSVSVDWADKLAAVQRVGGARAGTPGRGLAKLTRSLVVTTDEHAPHKYDDVRLVLDAMPNLEDARFQWDLEADIFPIFAFSELKSASLPLACPSSSMPALNSPSPSLAELRRLILTSIPLNASFPPICRPIFRNLVALSLVEVEVEPANIVELLTPVSFPSLRHLRLSQCDDLDKRSFFPDLSRAFFYRLDTLEVSFDDLPVIPMWVTQQCRVPVRPAPLALDPAEPA